MMVCCVFFLAFQLGWLVTAVEWCVFVCNHNARGDHWKNSFIASPHFIQAVMANGKKKKIRWTNVVFYGSQVIQKGHSVSYFTRVSNPSWHLGGEWAPLPPSVALHISVGFADPVAAPACLDPGFGDLSAGYGAPAGSICWGGNIKLQKSNFFKLMQFDLIPKVLVFFVCFCRCGVYGHMLNTSPVMRCQKLKRASEQHKIFTSDNQIWQVSLLVLSSWKYKSWFAFKSNTLRLMVPEKCGNSFKNRLLIHKNLHLYLHSI